MQCFRWRYVPSFDGVCSRILHEKMDAELQCIRDAGNSKKALYTIIGIEIVVAFLCSLIAGGLLGNMIMFLFRKVIFSMLAKGIVLSKVTWLTYVKGTLVVWQCI